MPLYHSQAHGIPKVDFPVTSNFKLSKHAVESIARRKINSPFDITILDLSRVRVFEVETSPMGALIKIACRRRYNYFLDICIVYDLVNLTIRTVWLNESTDPHLTLNKTIYSKP